MNESELIFNTINHIENIKNIADVDNISLIDALYEYVFRNNYEVETIATSIKSSPDFYNMLYDNAKENNLIKK